MNQKYYTVKEAAELLRVTTLTIRNYIKAGMIPFSRVGYKYLIPKEGIDEILNRSGEPKERGKVYPGGMKKGGLVSEYK